MYRIELAPGEQTVYRTIEELAVGLRNGLVTSRSRIYHNATQKWLPIEFHPHYKRAIELSAHRQDLPAPLRCPRRLDTLNFAVPAPGHPGVAGLAPRAGARRAGTESRRHRSRRHHSLRHHVAGRQSRRHPSRRHRHAGTVVPAPVEPTPRRRRHMSSRPPFGGTSRPPSRRRPAVDPLRSPPGLRSCSSPRPPQSRTSRRNATRPSRRSRRSSLRRCSSSRPSCIRRSRRRRRRWRRPSRHPPEPADAARRGRDRGAGVGRLRDDVLRRRDRGGSGGRPREPVGPRSPRRPPAQAAAAAAEPAAAERVKPVVMTQPASSGFAPALEPRAIVSSSAAGARRRPAPPASRSRIPRSPPRRSTIELDVPALPRRIR